MSRRRGIRRLFHDIDARGEWTLEFVVGIAAEVLILFVVS
jgi:hypothetical protein